jgi:hypothetical protein
VKPRGNRDASASWTRPRQSPGEIQAARVDYLQAAGRFEQARTEYNNLIGDILPAKQNIEDQRAINLDAVAIRSAHAAGVTALNAAITVQKGIQLVAKDMSDEIHQKGQAAAEGLPKVTGVANDFMGAGRLAALNLAAGLQAPFDQAAILAEIAQEALTGAKETADNVQEITLEGLSADLEVRQLLRELESKVGEEAVKRLEVFTAFEEAQQAGARVQATVAKGLRMQGELQAFRKKTASTVADLRYRDVTFRVFRNDPLQKYQGQFDLAARYAYLAATAYDYETNLLGGADQAGSSFLTDIVRQRALGDVKDDGSPVPGSPGLADSLGKLSANWNALKGQLGFNNPTHETNRFALRGEAFRIKDDADDAWQQKLESFRVDLCSIPEFRRYASFDFSHCPQTGLVIPLGDEHGGGTTVTFGQSFFGFLLGPGESNFDASSFVTKIRALGLWFKDYDISALARTPRVYLLPVGKDRMQVPRAPTLTVRDWTVVDQRIPAPFKITEGSLDRTAAPGWIAQRDSFSGDTLFDVRRSTGIKALIAPGDEFDDTFDNSQLIGRSVWNTRWLLVIPGVNLLGDPDEGVNSFIYGKKLADGTRAGGVTDIRLFLRTYAYSGG